MEELFPQMARFFLPERHLVTHNGFVRNKKPIKILRGFTILLYCDHKDAPLEIIQRAKLGACTMGWLPCPT